MDACRKVHEQKSAEEAKMDVDSETETNSGVNFPGESLEPLLGAATTLEDDTLENSVVVVEVRKNGAPFAFTFKKNQRIIIGKCEMCSQKKILSIECECKRVRYCCERCKERDK